MQLPPELYRQIIDEATCVPAALDTSHEATMSEDRLAVAAAIQISMGCKLALCLVSKAMHELTMEYLYEIITIREYRHIRPLVRLLNASDRPLRRQRGWWCRRLEIVSLGIWSPKVSSRQHIVSPYAWKWGKHSLWGLIPACPRLSILISRIEYRSQRHSSPAGSPLSVAPSIYSFPLPITLFQSVASVCAPTLRRMEWRDQTTVSLDVLERFLRHSSSLEVCKAFHFKTSPGFTPLDENAVFLGDDGATLDEVELDEYKLAMKVEWPTVYGNSGLVLPKLHTLDLGSFPPEATSWSLPVLRSVGAGYTRPDRPEFHTVDLKSLAPQLTHLAYRGNNDIIWNIIRVLPNLTNLTLWTPRPIPLPTQPYPTITCINLYAVRYIEASLRVLGVAALDGHLMSLVAVKVWGHIPDQQGSYYKIFAGLGVSLESSRELGSGPWS